MFRVFGWVYLFVAVAFVFWLPGITLAMFCLWVAYIFLEILFKPAGPPMTDSEVAHHEEAVSYEEEQRWQEQQEEREDRAREADRLAEEEAAWHEEERRKEQDDWRRLR